MKTLIYGAGPLGSLYAHRLFQAGKDVTILARNERYNSIQKQGICLVNEHTGQKEHSAIKVVNNLFVDDVYDLVVVLIRKNKLRPIFEHLRKAKNVNNILFLGNNVLGFNEYLNHLPKDKILFGFPGGGGSVDDQLVRYIDSEQAGGKRIPIRIGEMDGEIKERTTKITTLFESSQVPVEYVKDIDGWLKYHAAMVLPIVSALYAHNCDNYSLAKDMKCVRLFVQTCKKTGRILEKLGYKKRQPFQFNLFFWLPKFITTKVFSGIFNSKYAEIGFAKHAKSARDEMNELAMDFQSLTEGVSFELPYINER